MRDEGLAADYRLFLGGAPMVCAATGESAHGFSVDGEIDCRYGSRHDTCHFVWVGSRPDVTGPVSDREVDRLIGEGRIGLFMTDMEGECEDLAEAVHVAAFRLGVRRAVALQGWGRRMLRGERMATLDLPPTLIAWGSRHADDPALAISLYAFSRGRTAFSQGIRYGLARAALGIDANHGIEEAARADHGRDAEAARTRKELEAMSWSDFPPVG